jgi:hypothetical protein
MTDAGEVAADIGLEYMVHLLGHDLQAQHLQSVVRVAPRSKAVTQSRKSASNTASIIRATRRRRGAPRGGGATTRFDGPLFPRQGLVKQGIDCRV